MKTTEEIKDILNNFEEDSFDKEYNEMEEKFIKLSIKKFIKDEYIGLEDETIFDDLSDKKIDEIVNYLYNDINKDVDLLDSLFNRIEYRIEDFVDNNEINKNILKQ